MKLYKKKGGSGAGAVPSGAGFLNGEARSTAIGNAANSIAVVLTVAMPSAAYAITFSFKNILDGAPIDLTGRITAQNAAGFTITFNAPTDSPNYILSYVAAREY